MKTLCGAKKKKKYSEFPPPGSAVLALAFKKPYPVKTANPVLLKVGAFSPPGRGHLARLFWSSPLQEMEMSVWASHRWCQRCYSPAHTAQDSAHHKKIMWPQRSTVLRLKKNPSSGQNYDRRYLGNLGPQDMCLCSWWEGGAWKRPHPKWEVDSHPETEQTKAAAKQNVSKCPKKSAEKFQQLL